MSQDITIKQDGVATNISVDKLRTAKEDGGSVDWVPEEELKVSAVTVYRNGTYNAEDMGVYGFDEVNVSVTGRGGYGADLTGEKHKGNDEYLVSEKHDIVILEGEKPRTISNVDTIKVNSQSDGTIDFVSENKNIADGLTVSSNGTYNANRSGKYAYNSVSVNVSGSTYYDENDLPSCIALVANKRIKLADGTTYALDSYANGEELSFDGIVYACTGKTSSLIFKWINSHGYPEGIIPGDELLFSPKYANYDLIDSEIYMYGETSQAPLMVKQEKITKNYRSGMSLWTEQYADVFVAIAGAGSTATTYSFIAASKTPPAMHVVSRANYAGYYNGVYYEQDEIVEEHDEEYTSYTYDNKMVYYYNYSGTLRYYNEPLPLNRVYNFDLNNIGEIMWGLVYGNECKITDVTVTWPRPLDGQELTETYKALVYKDSIIGE